MKGVSPAELAGVVFLRSDKIAGERHFLADSLAVFILGVFACFLQLLPKKACLWKEEGRLRKALWARKRREEWVI